MEPQSSYDIVWRLLWPCFKPSADRWLMKRKLSVCNLARVWSVQANAMSWKRARSEPTHWYEHQNDARQRLTRATPQFQNRNPRRKTSVPHENWKKRCFKPRYSISSEDGRSNQFVRRIDGSLVTSSKLNDVIDPVTSEATYDLERPHLVQDVTWTWRNAWRHLLGTKWKF